MAVLVAQEETLDKAAEEIGQFVKAMEPLSPVHTISASSQYLSRKKLHDLKEAQLTLRFAVKELRQGYSFQDEHGDEKRALVCKSFDTLDQHMDLLIKLSDLLSNSTHTNERSS